MTQTYPLIDNYIYFYHTDQFLIIPVYPESLQDSMQTQFQATTPLARSAPIYSYSGSGPRSVSFSFTLHRDMMKEANIGKSNVAVSVGNDYVDEFLNAIQSAALPKYMDASKMVNPPLVAIRIGDNVFCKGVIQGSIQITYKPPIIKTANGERKYAIAEVSFGVYETDAFDAVEAQEYGSMRGCTLDPSLNRRIESNASGNVSALDTTSASAFGVGTAALMSSSISGQ